MLINLVGPGPSMLVIVMIVMMLMVVVTMMAMMTSTMVITGNYCHDVSSERRCGGHVSDLI